MGACGDQSIGKCSFKQGNIVSVSETGNLLLDALEPGKPRRCITLSMLMSSVYNE
jgi:hypothetical protein